MKLTFKKYYIITAILAVIICSSSKIYTSIIQNTQQLIISTDTRDLVNITKMNPQIQTQIYYATPNNFTGQILYPNAQCYLRKSTAQKLNRVQKKLELLGLGLKVWDAYRPLSVQQKMWQIFPNEQFVADPRKGSKHNRGTAVDITLINLETGQELEMPTKFDEFSEQAASHCTVGLSQEAIKNRELLHAIMKKHGFLTIKSEWWHFDDTDWKRYPILDVDFDKIQLQN